MKNTPALPPRKKNTANTYPVCSFKNICKAIERHCGNVHITEKHGHGKNKVVFLPEATQELMMIISYGRKSPMNLYEQKYLGFGHTFLDEDGNVINVVKHFIEIHTMNRSTVGASNLGPHGEDNPGLDFLEYYREEFLKHEKEFNLDSYGCIIDPFIKEGASQYILEGHTHPNLGCFFSGTDRVSGSARAAQKPISIFVCDPIRREMLAATGKSFEDTEVIVYDRKSADTPPVKNAIDNAYNDYVSTEATSNMGTEEIASITSNCLNKRGFSGKLRIRKRFDNRTVMKIKLVLPRSTRIKGSPR